MGKSQSRRLARLGAYLRPHWQDALLGVIALLTVNGLGVYIPQLIRTCVDRLSLDSLTYESLLEFVLPIMSLTAAMWLIRMASRIWLFGVGRKVEFDLKQKMFQHLLAMEPAYFATNTSGDLISRATSDVDNIRRLLGFAVLSLANTVFAYGLTLPYMLSINVTISVASLAVYPFMFLLVHFFSDRLRNEQATVQNRISELSELIQEDVSGIALIKIYAQENNELQAFGRKNQALLNANIQLAKSRNTLFPLIGGLASISSLIVIWLGAGQIAANTLTVGDFVALLLYVERLVFPTALLGFTITAFQRGEVSIDRIEAILANQPKIYDRPNIFPLPRVRGKLEAKHLTYQYPGSQTPALNDINFTIMPGETIAIVGAIGSGKSTLASALPRLLDIQSGQLFLDGIDITDIPLENLRRAIACVPQDSFLFSNTIKNNIRFGEPLCDIYTVEDAAKTAQIHPEIINFPQQYQTIVGERGITLSGGQRQRTALARALIVDAPVLLLDDALSSVDNQTATNILDNLSGGTQRKTVLFITHQLSAAATADRIFVMDRGKIVQIGPHQELVKQHGLYQSLWNQHHLEDLLH